MTKRYVVDASVIIKWVVGSELEPDQEKAIGLLDLWSQGTTEIFVPGLWVFEVGNFLGRELPEEATAKMDLLLALRLREISISEKMCRQCFDWMKTQKVTFYDAAYLAVAWEADALLLTADESFAGKMRPTGLVGLLKDFNAL